MDDFVFKVLHKEDYDVVMDFVVEHFAGKEPISITLPLTAEEGRTMFRPYVKNALRQNVSLAVYDGITGEMCAVRINLLGKNEQYYELDYVMEEQSLVIRQFNKVIEYLFGTSIAETLGEKNYFELFLLAVSEKYGKRGIATELYKRSKKIAEENGCKIMTVVCTSVYTLRATTGLNYQVLKQIPYADYVDPITGEKIFENRMKKPHELLSVLILRL